MDPFVFMLFLLGFCLLMSRMVGVGGINRCPDCGFPGGGHWPSCERAKS